MFNSESLKQLIDKKSDDSEALSLIYEALLTIEEYHYSIYKMETWAILYNYNNMSKEDYQSTITSLDNVRSLCHNSVINHLNILNRLCEQSSCPLIYTGVLSKDKPFRLEIANTVLDYVKEVIDNRVK